MRRMFSSVHAPSAPSGFTPPLLILAVVMLLFGGARAVQAASRDDVRDLVLQHWEHGLPYAETAALGPSAVPYLREMLEDPSFEEHWYNVVTALGIVGDREVTPVLIAFFERWRSEERSRETYMAASSVLGALGFVAAKGDGAALNYLRAATGSSFYLNKRVMLRGLGMDVNGSRVHLMKIAIRGLAFSGRAEALAHLRSLREKPESIEIGRALAPNVVDAIEVNQTIATKGLRSHFEPKEVRP